MDRRKCGTAIHVASDAYGMPLAAVVTAANVNDSVEMHVVLEALVVRPPAADVLLSTPDWRDLPRSRADDAGFRMEARKRGRTRQPGVGRIRCAVERCHAFLAQFGRIARRFDRKSERYLGWFQLAACIIFLRHEDNGFVR